MFVVVKNRTKREKTLKPLQDEEEHPKPIDTKSHNLYFFHNFYK